MQKEKKNTLMKILIGSSLFAGIITIGAICGVSYRNFNRSCLQNNIPTIQKLTDEALALEREKARLAWLENSRNRNNEGVMFYESQMRYFDREMERRRSIKYANVKGELPHREHGWYISKD